MAVKRYLVTAAVNNTSLNKPFWASLQTASKKLKAEIVVVAMKYTNPTAKRGKKKAQEDNTYAAELLPFLTRKRRSLGRNLTLFADVPVNPTAGNPLSGFEVLAASSSGIIGHVKRALHVIPTDHRTPRVLWSTGACTVAKYSHSKAGARSKAHHVTGAVIVEVQGETFFVRHVTATRNGSFTDLDTVYSSDGASKAPPALSVVLGDIHVGQEDAASLKGAEALVRSLRPKHLVLHDTLDFNSAGHHQASPKAKYANRNRTVEAEIRTCAEALNGFASWVPKGSTTHIVKSNHDCHLSKWMDEYELGAEVQNAAYWHKLWSASYDQYEATGEWPDVYEMECRRFGVAKNVNFLGREDSLRIAGVQHAFHGDLGVGGSKGTALGYSKLGCRVTIGHSHVPCIQDGVFQTGVTAKLQMSYNNKPSRWLHAHVVLGADGKRQLVIVTRGEHRAK